MTKLQFKPSDFLGLSDDFPEHRIAEQANKIFDAWYKENIEDAITVTGIIYKDKEDKWAGLFHVDDFVDSHKHKAKLIDIEEI